MLASSAVMMPSRRGFDAPPRPVSAPSGGGLVGSAVALCAAVMRQRRLLLLMLGLLVAYAVMTHGRRPDQADPDWTSSARHDRVCCARMLSVRARVPC